MMAFDERMAGTTCMTINVSMCIKASNPAVHSSEASDGERPGRTTIDPIRRSPMTRGLATPAARMLSYKTPE